MRNIGTKSKSSTFGGDGGKIAYVCRATALGPVLMAANASGVCCVQFAEDLESLPEQLQERFPTAELVAASEMDSPELYDWIEALDAHLSLGAPRPDLPVHLSGTDFQMKVWRSLLNMRTGDVISYGELAAQIGQPSATRAVAGACAANPIGVLVPCHRVVRGDGSLGGYRWGLDRKQALLEAEGSRKAA